MNVIETNNLVKEYNGSLVYQGSIEELRSNGEEKIILRTDNLDKTINVLNESGVFGLVMPFGGALIWIYPFLTAPMTTVQRVDTAATIMNTNNIVFSILSIIIAAIMFMISLHIYNSKENF